MAYTNPMGRADTIEEKTSFAGDSSGDVAVVVIDNPPNGVLTPAVRASLSRELIAAGASSDVRAVVIVGRDGAFAMGTGIDSGGALAQVPDAPTLGDLCDAIEAMDKPVVAAITGAALGNGLELALAAHVRVAGPEARLGAPEITIGIVPGSGGTQRLPKVVGGLAALRMLLSGRAVNGTSAHKLGLVDRLAEGDVLEAAIDEARTRAENGAPLARSSQRRDRLGEGQAFLEAVAEHRRIAAVSPLDAPLRLIECVEAALLLPYEIGRGLEIAAFEDLVESDHSRALRHVFAADRRLVAASAVVGRTPSRALGSIGLIGGKGIGSEIAVACLDAGFSVTVAERSDEALESGVMRIIEHYDARVAAGKMKEDAVEATLERMNAVCGFRTLSDADVVIDPGPSVSKALISELDAVLKAGAVLATGSEHVDVATLATATRRPSEVVGFRLYPGMQRNRMAEVIPSAASSPRAIATVRALARKLDRLIVETGPGPVGIGQRVAEALHAAADFCVEEGARISQVDAALQDWGLPLGSFAWRDTEGLVRAKPRRGAGDDLTSGLVEAGRLGRVNGRGFYAYRQRGRKGVEDPDVTAFIDAVRKSKGKRARTVSDGDIRLRCVAAMAGAGAQALADGTARAPSDIDMVSIHGLGFARRTGGVMFAADLIGLEQVQKLVTGMADAGARVSLPSPIFKDLIRAGQSFAALDG
ncbi:enoyl-CoA hydratase-related protein [Boseongicola aestuarii]|uniref:Fatty acid oxidation complex subunit alpha n=1 Tax=Boseongicola aestuarii TaxID=1470561 RepID=A0A238J3K1_9RHOB|nr:enoyl-CoA hydratase-related protein [Boseongicola aestuarii]SMX25236.1 Fatty acid oxidation complex subunit alpha [Boseongicola aestuarii]